MRVITGSAKGYGLKAPRRMKLRPTPARVKEALFSSLAARVPGAHVLDLFAGTGAFAIETLSRGAAAATLVEKDPRAITLIGQNLRKTRLEKNARVLRVDVRQALEWFQREAARFDVIFADPPYQKTELPTEGGVQAGKHAQKERGTDHLPRNWRGWLSFLLCSEILPGLLAPDGVLLIEHYKKEKVVDSSHFTMTRQLRFGDTIVGVFRHRSSGEGVISPGPSFPSSDQSGMTRS